METQNNMKYVVVGIVLFLAGAIAAVFADPYLPASLSNSQKGYQTGFTAARTLVENSSIGGMLKTPDDIRTLSGTVTALSGDSLTLHIQSVNPFDDQKLNDRTVIITTSTTVNKLVPKDPKVFQAEMASFAKSAQGVLPVSFTTTVVSASSISVGDSINVSASENVKTLKEFTASDIQILLKTVTP